MKLTSALFTIFSLPSLSFALTIDVSQPSISGSGSAFTLGSPFGQSFIPTSLEDLLGIYLAVVNDSGAGDLLVSLYHSDASGSALIGAPVATGTLTEADIHQMYQPGATPLYLPIYFDTPYNEIPGEHLAFTVSGGSLTYYYGSGSSYSGGRLLSDDTKDLTFGTIVVPEPGTSTLTFVTLSCLLMRRLRHAK